MAKRRKTRITKTKFASLHSVFPNDAMHAEIARLMVLYEDLKIETLGITKKISALGQATDGTYSQRYFLRRSIATLNECGQCITRLDGMQDFKRIKEMMKKQQGLELWDDAVKVLSAKKPKWVIKEIRNDVGGHFGTTAGMRAIKTLKAGTIGKIEYEQDMKRSRGAVHCHFVGELTARAFVKHADEDPEVQFRKLLDVVVHAHKVVLACVFHLIYSYVWPRFGV